MPLLGTGNRGKIYRLDSDTVSTLLLDASPTQVTGFGRGPNGSLYAITGNIGKVFRMGPGFEKKGSFESPVLDAGAFAYWGRISYRGLGKITVYTRSGNRSHPESNWSPWATLQTDTSAAALRFLRSRPHRFTLGSILAIQNRLDARHRPARTGSLLR